MPKKCTKRGFPLFDKALACCKKDGFGVVEKLKKLWKTPQILVPERVSLWKSLLKLWKTEKPTVQIHQPRKGSRKASDRADQLFQNAVAAHAGIALQTEVRLSTAGQHQLGGGE